MMQLSSDWNQWRLGCERTVWKGLKTLVLERGRIVEHVQKITYDRTSSRLGYELRGGFGTPEQKEKHPSECARFFNSATTNIFPQPMISKIPTGGQAFLLVRWHIRWVVPNHFFGKQTLSSGTDLTLKQMPKMGHGWIGQFAYKESNLLVYLCEKFAGISGEGLGLPQLPG